MRWFRSRKKEEDSLPLVTSSEQGDNSDLSNGYSEKTYFESTPISQRIQVSDSGNSSEPFFVRIDKFNEAKRGLMEADRKMRELDSVLNKLIEVKQKEDEEIESWKQDMKIIKGYLDDINNSVFSKL